MSKKFFLYNNQKNRERLCHSREPLNFNDWLMDELDTYYKNMVHWYDFFFRCSFKKN